ncbi:MAG TPA: PKD domain-containing protein, partial [Chryseosolibacter sp.]|nr:PKD domain-containing protein [Chryseosolibacter sp.]
TVFKGIVDGWIARLAADGSTIIDATYTGTVSFDQVYFVDLNSDGNVFCYGQTAGHMPITPGVYNNINSGQFLQKFSADLSGLEFSTVFGSGSTNGLVIPNISPTAFLVNDCNNIYMAGWGGFVNSSSQTGFWQSSTHNMPLTSDAHQKTTSGSDFYFMVLNGDATQLVYSTYLGGNFSKTHVDGGTSRFDKYGIVYHAVCSGCGFGNSTGGATSDFPTTPNAHSRVNASLNCNNAAFKFDLSSLRAMFQTNSLDLATPGFNNVCHPDSIVFENLSTGGKSITWDFDDGTIITQQDTDPRSVVHQFKEAGDYYVKLKITDLSTCSQTDSVTNVVHYFKDNIRAGQDSVVCEGKSFRLTAYGGVTYNWTSDDGTFSSSEQFPMVQPDSAASYFVTVVDANGCARSDTLNLTVTHDVRAHFQTYEVDFSQPGYNHVCYPDSIRFKNQSVNGEEFVWDFDDGVLLTRTKNDTTSIVYGFEDQRIYHVELKAINVNTCNKRDSVTKTISYFKAQIDVGDDGEICEGTAFQLTATGGTEYLWSSEHQSFVSESPSPIVLPPQTTKYFVTVRDQNNCIRKDTVEVVVLDSVHLDWQYRLNGNCVDRPSVAVQNLTTFEEDVAFRFDFGDGTTSELTEVEHVYENDGFYSLKFIAERKFCYFEEAVTLPIYKLLIPNVFTPEVSRGYNDYFEVGFGPDAVVPPEAGEVRLIVLDRWGKKVFESQDYKNNWEAPGLASGVYYVQVRVGDWAICKSWLHIVK